MLKDRLKSNMSAAANAAAKGSKEVAQNSTWQSMTTMGFFHGHGNSTTPVDGATNNAPMMGEVVAQLFDSPLGQEVFNKANITANDGTQITYALKPALCDAVAQTMDNGASNLSSGCKAFLTNNSLQLGVKLTGSDVVEISLLFGGATVGTLRSAPTLLGSSGDLANVKKLANALGVLHVDTLKGAIAWQLQFATQGKASGCHNGAKLCLTFNVDQDIDIKGNILGHLALSIGTSPQAEPALFMSMDDQNGIVASLNLGTVHGKMNQDAELHLDGLGGQITIPKTTDGKIGSITVENLHTGTKLTLDMNKDDERKIAFTKLWTVGNMLFAQVSPFNLDLKIESGGADCALAEELTLSNGVSSSDGKSTFKWLLPQDGMSSIAALASAPAAPATGCAANALLRSIVQSLSAADTCQKPLELQADKGSFHLVYDVKSGNTSVASADITIAEGKCMALH